MLRRIAVVTVLGGLALSAAACNKLGGSNNREVNAATGNDPPVKVDIGPALFQGPKNPPAKPTASTAAIEPLLFAAQLRVEDKVDIPAQRDGKIMLIGTEIQPGEVVPKGHQVFTHPYKRDPKTGKPTEKRYRELTPGEQVAAGQVVMVLDDREAMAEYDIHFAAVPPAHEEVKAAETTVAALKEILARHIQIAGNNSVGTVEVLKAKVDVARAESDLATKNAALVKAQEELKKAEVLLDFHYIRTLIGGYLQPFNRKPGEGVRAGETVLQVTSNSVLRAEGMVPTGYQRRLKRGMPVVVEPSFEVIDDKPLYGHSLPVTGVAFSNHPEPMIVSVSEDKYLIVWKNLIQQRQVRNEVALRCVACTPPGAKAHLALYGADDGLARLLDLDLPSAEPRVLKSNDPNKPAHKGVIQSVTFSPDGRFCATADSKDICLWDVATAELKYRVQTVHHLGDITGLRITPQAKLISAARDNTIAIWSLGEKNASLDSVLSGRSGYVERPGVSSDGQRLLYDIGSSLRVVSLPDLRTEAVMHNVTDTYRYGGFAQFTPDNQFIVTGTNVQSRLSVWRAPSATHSAAEIRQLVPRSGQEAFTCAAVSPNPLHAYAAAGTKDGKLYVWPLPTAEEMKEPLVGYVYFIDNMTESSSRQVRVWVQFDNGKAQLLPGGSVTVVVDNPAAVR
ncbi:MAG: hypothetical protein ACJ8F7_18670 [Gemmataceae bacterium]